MALKFRAELIEPAPRGGWYVSNGDQSVGPVALELLVRGVESGRVPVEAFVRHEAWKVWRPLTELTIDAGELVDEDGPATIRESSPTAGMPMAPAVAAQLALAAGSLAEGNFPPPLVQVSGARPPEAAAPATDAGPLDLVATFDALALAHGLSPLDHAVMGDARGSEPPNGPTSSRGGPASRNARSSRPAATDDIASAARPAESADRMDGDELAGASDLGEALLLFLGALVRRLDADGALLHRVDDEGAVVACAHGRGAANALGCRTRLTDSSFLAASSGHVVIVEPDPGPGGEIIRKRLAVVCGAPPAPGGAGMYPIVAGGRLRAFIEVGRSRAIAMREWAEAERLARSLVARINAADW